MADPILQTIPETITVHLGPPDSDAENITVPFADYVKNVASSEIYPSWPEEALRANIYAITTYALNRIYNEWYPSRGYNFDITNSTRYDQAFVPDRDIFENISTIVDNLFNDYVVRQGTVNPLFTQFCNGTTSTCDGLSQWGTVDLANQGLTPYQILQRYYGDDINIIMDAPVENIPESYPGTPLRIGDAGNDVETIQDELNRIARNYPAIPRIPDVNGVFDTATQDAVRKFQEIFDLPQTGEVDRATWYRIKRYYVGVKNLSELISEGVTLQEAQVPYEDVLTIGSTGTPVRLIQYYLAVIGYFNENFDVIPINGIYDQATADAVSAFQTFYGLTSNGEVNRETWNRLQEVYRNTIGAIPPTFYGNRAKLYPGYFLSEGMRGQEVTDLQTYLSFIADYYNDIPKIPVTGYFGEQTKSAVQQFQRLFGLEPNGAVGAVTWNEIAKQYDFLVETEL
ncbi:MAG: peptidoglycan-binding protein [Acutalibacteraceae bacterium]|nr:peptidoglycan-binding protein [Acutalibacteraceae bacterium]